MNAEPQKEHAWLQKFIGEWTFEGTCIMGPDQPPMTSTGTYTVHPLGGLWIMGEGRGEMPDGGPTTSMLTLGYDPQKQRFVGTFIASMMTHLWAYEGGLDGAGKVLTLDTVGPTFSGNGAMAKYQDIIELNGDDHHVLRSQMLGDDGKWHEFMSAHYRRKA